MHNSNFFPIFEENAEYLCLVCVFLFSQFSTYWPSIFKGIVLNHLKDIDALSTNLEKNFYNCDHVSQFDGDLKIAILGKLGQSTRDISCGGMK